MPSESSAGTSSSCSDSSTSRVMRSDRLNRVFLFSKARSAKRELRKRAERGDTGEDLERLVTL